MDDMTGMELHKFIGKYQRNERFLFTEALMKFFELDPSARIKKMSKGMKQT